MVAAISAINSYTDPEYMRILQELMALGIAPSGNKTIDKSKLENAKAQLIEKIQHKEKEEKASSGYTQALSPVNETQDDKRVEMEEQRLGAMTVAELNRLYFGI